MLQNTFECDGIEYTFFIHNREDAIQKVHLNGEIFSYNELQLIKPHISNGDVILDIGANVGNHSIFFAKTFPDSVVVPVEPNREAISILTKNLDANDCKNIMRDFIGVGISNKKIKAMSQRGGPANLGGSKIIDLMDPDEMTEVHKRNIHEIELISGDEAFSDYSPDFIKIDVEGHEFEVLEGLEGVISQCRPKMHIEVQNDDIDRFKTWVGDHKYEIVSTDTHYAKVTNYIILPR